MRWLLLAFPLFFLFTTCHSPPQVRVSGADIVSKVNSVYIESINFYKNVEFTEAAPHHPYMSVSRNEVRIITEKNLKNYGMQLLPVDAEKSKVAAAICIKIDMCIQLSFLGVRMNLRAQVFYKDKFLFEITGRAVSVPNQHEVIKNQEDLGARMIAAFAQKLGRKTNPPK